MITRERRCILCLLLVVYTPLQSDTYKILSSARLHLAFGRKCDSSERSQGVEVDSDGKVGFKMKLVCSNVTYERLFFFVVAFHGCLSVVAASKLQLSASVLPVRDDSVSHDPIRPSMALFDLNI